MGYASGVMVFAVTQTGEPGYSLYIPSEYALHLYNKIMTVRYSSFCQLQKTLLTNICIKCWRFFI